MKNIIFSFLLLSILFISCEKDFLEVDSPDLTDQALWADPALVEAYIINQYTGIQIADKEPSIGGWNDSPFGLSRGYHWAMWASNSDEAVYSNDDQTYLVQKGQLSPSNYGWTSTTWGRSYRAVREINLCLSKLDDTPIEADRVELLNAELRFLRAYRYFNLLKSFGKVPVVGDVVATLEDDFSSFYEKQEITEVVSYIAGELDAAIAKLPRTSGSDWQNGRATVGAAMALKSRLLLYAASPLYTNGADDAQKWQVAANAAKDVMDLNLYDLVDNLDSDPVVNYRTFFLTNNTIEDIFTRQFNVSTHAIPIERMNAPNGFGGWGGNCPMQNLVDDFNMNNGYPIDDPLSGYDPQNPYESRDPRFYATILFNGAPYRGRDIEVFLPEGKDSPDGNEPWNTSPTGYYMRKFLNDEVDLNDWDNQGHSPWRYFRYAEILLNYAEAQNEANGPDESVYEAINKIRLRADMPGLPAGLSTDMMRERIRNERRIELLYEEHRYFDVRRWKIAMETENQRAMGISISKAEDGSLTYAPKVALAGKTFMEKHYWFPIPQEEINAANGALEQNPGYN